MKYPPDAAHPITERFAADLYGRCDLADVPGTEPWRGQFGVMWEAAAPELREVFRARARRLLAGDTSVLPQERPISGGPRADQPDCSRQAEHVYPV